MHHLEYFARLCSFSVDYSTGRLASPNPLHFAQGVRQKHNVRLLEKLGYVKVLRTRYFTGKDEEGDPINPVFVFQIVPENFVSGFRHHATNYNIAVYDRARLPSYDQLNASRIDFFGSHSYDLKFSCWLNYHHTAVNWKVHDTQPVQPQQPEPGHHRVEENTDMVSKLALQLEKIQSIIADGASEGFNSRTGNWTVALSLSQKQTSKLLREYYGTKG